MLFLIFDKGVPEGLLLGEQLVRCNVFGIELPAKCGTESVSRVIPEKKRGRPVRGMVRIRSDNTT